MITDALLAVLFGAARLVVGLIPDWTPPSFIAEIHDKVHTFGGMAAGFSAWVPWPAVSNVLSVIITTFTTINAVRLGLWLWSKLPVVGR
jgi:hypothetical protein